MSENKETYESVVQQCDALEKKLADVAAENYALKVSQSEIYDYTQQFTSSDDREMWNAMHDIYKLSSPIETPVTDEFTRELMAKGVEQLLKESFREEIAGALADFDGMDEKSLQTLIWSGQPPEPDGDVWCVEYMTRAAEIQSKIRDFASQLRKGINDAQ